VSWGSSAGSERFEVIAASPWASWSSGQAARSRRNPRGSANRVAVKEHYRVLGEQHGWRGNILLTRRVSN
jgi:hypothetical protein